MRLANLRAEFPAGPVLAVLGVLFVLPGCATVPETGSVSCA